MIQYPPTTTTDEKQRNARMAVLPVGSCEQHGPYLPLTTDTLIACILTSQIAQTYMYQSVTHSGLSALVVVNAHGGNDVLRNIVQEHSASGRRAGLYPARQDWEEARQAAGLETSGHEDMHAGEIEISILLHACPEMVRDGYRNADWAADGRRDLPSLGMRGYTESGAAGSADVIQATVGLADPRLRRHPEVPAGAIDDLHEPRLPAAATQDICPDRNQDVCTDPKQDVWPYYPPRGQA